MAAHPEPSARRPPLDDRRRRGSLLPADVTVQAPPNLAYDDFPRLLDAGIDDWGGVSPVTIDHVNPEAPWPELRAARGRRRAARGLELAPRLPVYPELRRRARPLGRPGRAADGAARVRRARARARGRLGPGETGRASRFVVGARRAAASSTRGASWARRSSSRLFRARGDERQRGVRGGRPAAPRGLRRRGQLRRHAEHPVHERLLLPLRLLRLLEGQAGGEPARRAVPRAARGDRAPRARGVGARRDRGLPAGRHPPGLHGRLLRSTSSSAIKDAVPELHVHAFSRARGLAGRRDARRCRSRTTSRGCATLGLGSLPGTAAEILDDEVRAVICPDKVSTDAVARGARGGAPRRPALERDDHVRRTSSGRGTGRGTCSARASSSERTGGFTEFVPLPFVHMEAPIYLQRARAAGPDLRRVAPPARRRPARAASRGSRTSRRRGSSSAPRACARRCARACNDLGGTLMNESISRAAGSEHGQEMPPETMEALIRATGRVPRSGRRSTATRPRSAAPPRSARRRSPSRSTRPCARRG